MNDETEFIATTLRDAQNALSEKRYGQALEKFLNLFDQGQIGVASNIAWSYDNMSPRNIYKSVSFYEIAARHGNSYSQHALAGLYVELGKLDDAIVQYMNAIKNGRQE